MTTTQAHSDERELFRRIAEGEESAFRECYHRYGRLLFPFLLRLTRSESLTEDLIQETLLRVWLRRDQLTEVGYPRAWIYRIASNLALNWMERQGVRERALERVGETAEAGTMENDPHTTLTVRAIREVVAAAMAELPERRRLIYRLHRVEGLKMAEIAEQLGVSESTVKNTVMVATRFIREQVEKAGYTLPLWLILLFF